MIDFEADCNYDNGDCCATPVLQAYCTVCVCHETGLVHTSTTLAPKGKGKKGKKGGKKGKN